jgi:cytosine/adenosine deaminase-related metal-dependent hydrolase
MDFGDRLVTPALINAHTHLALGVMRGMNVEVAAAGNMVEELFFGFESQLDAADVRAFARMGAYESLLHGVGLVWEHYYEAPAIVEAMRDVGLSAVVAPTLQDLAGPGVSASDAQLQATEEIHRDARLREAGIFAALGPHATDTVSAELWGRARQMSEAQGLPVHAHLAQSVEEYTRAWERHGCSPTEWLQRLGILDLEAGAVFAHLLYASAADLDRLDAGRHRPIFCPYSQLIFGFPAPVLEWEERGLPWAVATDCAANNDSMNVLKELRFVAGQRSVSVPSSARYRAFLEAGDPESARAVWEERGACHQRGRSLAETDSLLARVWSLPGAAHPAFDAGVIRAGALANLLVWDLEHPALWPSSDPLRVLAMGDASAAIHAMFVVGSPIGDPGDFHRSLRRSPAYREAHAEASARLARLEG